MEQAIPRNFVWQRAGTEASSTLDDNIRLKEAQRRNNKDGIFLWGMGNPVTDVRLKMLLDREPNPMVLFTHIVSKPRPQDSQYLNQPKTLFVWQGVETAAFDEAFQIPEGSQVTTYAKNKPRHHYALVCQSDEPLTDQLEHHDDALLFDQERLRNITPDTPEDK